MNRPAARARLRQVLGTIEAELTNRYYPPEKSIKSAVSSYRADIGELVSDFLRAWRSPRSGGRISKAAFRRDYKQAISDGAQALFAEGWRAGGGDVEDTEPADIDVLNTWADEQQAFVNAFSDWLVNPESNLDDVPGRLDAWAFAGRNLAEIAQARAMGDPPLTYEGENGVESCDECQEYKGQTHRLSWWEKRGLTKRNGNDNFTCGRWEPCQHHFYHAKTGALVIT